MPRAKSGSAYQRALGLLARREHSRRELAAKLVRGGFEADEAAAALDRLGEVRYQDDLRFAASLLRSRVSQGYGPMRIEAELKSHGLAAASIAALLVEAQVDWSRQAWRQLRRRYCESACDRAERARRWQFLARRGFTAQQAASALAQAGTPEDGAADWEV